MYELVDRMGDIPVKSKDGSTLFLKEAATPTDASLVQTSVARVNGRRPVYIPVYRQMGASPLSVVDGLKATVPDMKGRLTYDGTDLKVIMVLDRVRREVSEAHGLAVAGRGWRSPAAASRRPGGRPSRT